MAVGGGAAGRVFDGTKWETVRDGDGGGGGGDDAANRPKKPIVGKGNGEIFVSIPSFRDGQRCGSTLRSIFENASDPSKVYVGLVEQNDPGDAKCITEYCASHGVKVGTRSQHEDLASNRRLCPHHDQIRLVSIHDLAAKGPVYARSLARKVLGNEEYCLQIDSHTDFVKGWDAVAKEEWANAENEYAVLSTVLADVAERDEYEKTDGSKAGEVPRQCKVRAGPVGIPMYEFPADGTAVGLARPLLSRAWSAGFSFAKCHLEENVPYDNFAPQLFDAEQFTRFARMWTRGYDVYTPSRNIAYHDYGPNPDVGSKAWTKNEPLRRAALTRMKTLINVKGGDSGRAAQANLGAYGLGRRRTLRKLQVFVGIDLEEGTGNEEQMKCANPEWVSFDLSIPPYENLYEDADDLDPAPEYPLRTLTQRPGLTPPIGQAGENISRRGQAVGGGGYDDTAGSAAPYKTIATLWLFGLFVWYMVFVNGQTNGRRPIKRKKKSSARHKSV